MDHLECQSKIVAHQVRTVDYQCTVKTVGSLHLDRTVDHMECLVKSADLQECLDKTVGHQE